MPTHETVKCGDLDEAIKRYASDGFRLDMIMPADAPREALMSNGGGAIRIQMQKPSSEQGRNPEAECTALTDVRASATEWITGRAGMMYRDLIPDRLGGKVIASHIRIVDGGEVADSVHYHKIDFQIIYCVKGAIRVVYEDQGEPFWLTPGDLVLQPPEIRHRVLEAEAGSEVIEVTSPAEHETWFDHELTLPTKRFVPDRIFGSQRFGVHTNAGSVWKPSGKDDVLVAETNVFGVRTLRDSLERSIVSVHKETTPVLFLMNDGKGVEVTFPE